MIQFTRFRRFVQSRFQQNWSSENENIPLQQQTSFATFNQQTSPPQNLNNEMFFSMVSESEEGSPHSGFSEIILSDPDSIESTLEGQNVDAISVITVSNSSNASSVSEKPKVSFLRKTLMRAAKKNKV